jgi:hypothetical protein
MTRTLLPLALTLVACGDLPGDTNCDTCDCIAHPALISQYPDAGDTDAFYRSDVWMRTGGTPYDQSLVLYDADGNPVDGTVNTYTGNVLQFVPTAHLTSGAAYSLVQLTNACEAPGIDFTVSDVGAPITDPAALNGHTWRVPMSEGRPPAESLEKQAVIDLIAEDLLITITAIDGNAITANTASTLDAGLGQNLCVPTTPVMLEIIEDPYGEGTIDAGYVGVQGSGVPTLGGTVSGAFSSDGTRLEGIQLRTILDVDGANEALDDDLCATVAQVGVDCEPCPSGTGECMTFEAHGLIGTDVGDSAVVSRTQAEVEADAACQSTSTGS